MASTTSFAVPKVNVNEYGWGPTAECVPPQFLDRPYAPFSKSEKLGRVADFTERSKEYRRRREGVIDENPLDDSSFHVVDLGKGPVGKQRHFRRRRFFRRGANQRFQRGSWKSRQNKEAESKSKNKRKNANTRFNRRRTRWKNRLYRPRDRRETVIRQPSVKVQADWKVLEQYDLTQLAAARATPPAAPEDLLWCGHLEFYDDEYDRVSTKRSKPLQRVENRQFFYVTTTEDEVMEKLATTGKGNVFGTDTILAHLMASPRSVYPWDVIVQRVGEGNNKTIFFDKRDDQLDYHTVNETAYVPPNPDDKDSINSPHHLSVEATSINQNFSQQILKKSNRKEFDYPNPFFDEDEAEDGSEPAAVAYRYRRWKLSEEYTLVARTELHGYTKKKGKEVLMTSYAINEWDSKLASSVNWRRKLDGQRGAVLATELKNNSCKLAKWTAQSILCGADQMKIGYVSRVHNKDRFNHVVLGTQFYKPLSFAKQITLSQKNIWGILKMLCDVCMAQPQGKYVLVKDPGMPIVRLYQVPPGTFSDEEEDDDDDDSSSGSDSD